MVLFVQLGRRVGDKVRVWLVVVFADLAELDSKVCFRTTPPKTPRLAPEPLTNPPTSSATQRATNLTLLDDQRETFAAKDPPVSQNLHTNSTLRSIERILQDAPIYVLQ